jgi:hypothetical protein
MGAMLADDRSIMRRLMMMDCLSGNARVGLLLVLAGALTLLADGCGRAMIVPVRAQVLDTQNRPLVDEAVRVISNRHAVWPRPAKGQNRIAPTDLKKYGDVYKTEPNGFFAFVAVNTEPVSMFDALIFDSLFPPSVKFLVMMPDRQSLAYGVTFVPGTGLRNDRFTYQHFDLTTGKTLKPKYCDATGGLDIMVQKPPCDPNDRWSTPHPSLRIRIVTSDTYKN